MLAMEAAFGLPGIVAAPIYYAYLKQELMDAGKYDRAWERLRSPEPLA